MVDQTQGNSGSNTLSGDSIAQKNAGLPGALGFWGFDNAISGVFADARGGPSVSIYQFDNNAATQITDGLSRGDPNGEPNGALEFNGENTFGFINHDPSMEVTQGTVSLWIKPDAVRQCEQIILSKNESGADDGGHFRLGIDGGGRIFLLFAEGDGGSNNAWNSSKAYYSEGDWTHIAVSFTEDGITVDADGVAIPDYGWYRKEGNLDSQADATEGYILKSKEPWVLGVDTSRVEANDDPATLAASSNQLEDAFDGAIADFGLRGGFTTDDALDSGQVWDLFLNGPGEALTASSGPQPMFAGDDVLGGGAANDTIDGDVGNDQPKGGEGHDTLNGGYGDDILESGAGDDVLVGRKGKVTLLFNPQINAKRDIILEHVNEDRSNDWAGVADENNEAYHVAFETSVRSTKITLQDTADNVVGTIDVRSNDFDANRDIEQFNAAEATGLDLFG